MILKKQIKELVDILTKKFNTKKIFIFGSYAYGAPNLDSDLDLCITTELGVTRKIDLLREVRKEIMVSFQFPIDLLIYDDKEFAERAAHKNTLEYKISNQGLLIYG
ncbi:MAG: nucleotidyltransferase domain-containing protein [Bacteroidetes bacterium]|nr:MAG: nucleotidyltransferase domain-containing protein [Bacteroidota bacterium]